MHRYRKQRSTHRDDTTTSRLGLVAGLSFLWCFCCLVCRPFCVVAGAVMFFLCYEFVMLVISYNAQYDARVSRLSLNVKRTAAVISLISLLALVAMSSQFHHFRVPIAVCEWTSTIMIQIF
eukprot:scpid99703/ scgid23313/ 